MGKSFFEYYIKQLENDLSGVKIVFKSCCDCSTLDLNTCTVGDCYFDISDNSLYVVCEDSNHEKQLARLTF